jgi:hypothetical protein
VGTLVLLAARAALALPLAGPLVVSDELGYLTNARLMSGGHAAELLDTAIYRGGYSLLLVPVMAVVHDPRLAYQLVLLENVALAATLPALLYLLLRRCFAVPPRLAAIAALAGACYPSLTQATGTAMSENLLAPLTVVWLLCFGAGLDARSRRARACWGVGLGLSAAFLWTAHGRMVVAVGLTFFAVVALAVRRRLPAAVAAAALASLGAGLLLGHALNEYLIGHNYGGAHQDEAGLRLSVLGHLDQTLSAGRNLLGQLWYVLVATLGLGLLVVADARRLVRSVFTPDASAAELTESLLLLTTAGLLVLSALSFPTPERPDHLVYGRYVEVVSPVVLALGLVRLSDVWPARRIAAAGGVLLALTAVVAALRHGLDLHEGATWANVAALPWRLGDIAPSAIVGAGLVAVACLVLLVAVRRRWAWAAGPLLILMLLGPTVLSERELRRTSRDNYTVGWTGPEDALDGRATRVGYDIDRSRDEFIGGLKYSWFLTGPVLVKFHGRSAAPPSRYVISSAAWARTHPAYPATALWRDPARDQTLWRLETDPLAPLRRIERCLSAAGVATRRLGPVASPTGLRLPTGAGISLRPSTQAAIRAQHDITQLLGAAGRRGTAVVRRGRLVATYRRAGGNADKALRRCL